MRKQIKLLASEYDVGDQSDLHVCPFCKGGSSGEPSFTMNILPEGVVYICYRANCSKRGFVPSLRLGETPSPKKRQKEPKPFLGDRSPLPETMIPFLVNKFPCMTEELLQREQVQYSHERERVLLPMFDVRGYEYGVQARSYRKVPKAISYFDNTEVPKLHFPLGYVLNKAITLVEDHFSAMILCDQGVSSIALLGTNLSDKEAVHLATCGVHQITFFLDADAAHKAVQFKKEYGLEFSIDVYYHETDPKDLTQEQIKEFKDALQYS